MAVASLGFLKATIGRHDEAVDHLSEALAVGERFDNAYVIDASRVQLGVVALTRGELEAANDLLDEGQELSLATQSTQCVTLCLAAFARLALERGEPRHAALIAGAVDALPLRAGVRVWPSLRRGDDLLERVRRARATDEFDEVFAAGSRLSRLELVAAVRHRLGWPSPNG